jgi:hypothetical protein
VTAPTHRSRRLAPILPALGIGLVAFAWLNHVNPPFPVTDDGIRDQLLARDCTDLGRCHLIGAPASFAEIHHGPTSLHLLVAVRLLGGETAAARTVVLVLMAASVATLFIVVWRWLHPTIAAPAAVILIALLAADAYPSLLINPSFSALPDVLAAAGLLCYGLSGRRRFLFAAAFALGVAISVHIGSASLLVGLLAIAVLARPSAGPLLAAVAVLLATYLFTSSAALRANLLGLAHHGLLAPASAGGLFVVAVSAALGPCFRRLSWGARAWTIGLILVLPFALASLWLVFWQAHHFGVMYLHPILAPAAVLGAAALSLLFQVGGRRRSAVRWIPTGASLVVLASAAYALGRPATSATAPVSSPWTLAEAEAIAGHALIRGWGFEDLVFRLQSDSCRELLTGMSLASPPPRSLAAPSGRQLQVVKMSRDAGRGLATPDDLVTLGPTDVAVVREIESWLRPDLLRACRHPIGSARPPVCQSANRRPIEVLTSQRFLFVTRSYPVIHDLDLPPPYVARYELPLMPAAGESREFVLTDAPQPGRECSWRITQVERLQSEDLLPSARVRLRSERGEPGLLVIERPWGGPGCASGQLDTRFPPCIFEAAPGDPLSALVGSG